MATWLEQFAARLGQIEATRGAKMRGGNSADTIYQILASRMEDAHVGDIARSNSKNADKSSFGFKEDVLRPAMSGGGRVLDILSRGNYASANFKKEQSRASKDNRKDFLGGTLDELGDLGSASKAAWRGLTGQDKTTYSDVIRERSPEFGEDHKFLTGALGFVGDVALDPTTYIGAGLIKSAAKGTVKGAEKVTGKEISGKLANYGKSKTPLGVDKVMAPSEKTGAELAATGRARVRTDGNLAKFLNKYGATSKAADKPIVDDSFDILDESDIIPTPPTTDNLSKILQITSGKERPSFVAGVGGIEDIRPRAAEGTGVFKAQAALKGIQSQIDELTKGVQVPRYDKETLESIPHPFKDSDIIENITKQVEKTREIPASTNFKESLKAGISRLAENRVGDTNQFRMFGRSGTIFRGNIAGGAAKASDKPTLLTPAMIAKMADTGQVPAMLKKAYFSIDGKPVNAHEYIMKLHNDKIDAELFAEPRIEKYMEDVVEPVTKKVRQKMDPVDRLIFGHVNKETLSKLDPEDAARLNKLWNLKNGETAARNYLASLTGKTTRKDFGSVKEFAEARKAGQITQLAEELTQKRLEKYGVKHTQYLERRLAAAERALEKARKTPTKQNIAKAEKAVDAVDDATSNKAGKLRAEAVPDIWTSPAVIEQVETKVQKALSGEEIVTRTKPALTPKAAEAVTKIVQEVNLREFVEPLDRAKYGFVSGTGTRRTRPTPGAGLGRNHRGFNKFSQATLGKKVVSAASGLVRGTAPDMRPTAMYDMAMPMLNAAEIAFRQNNIPIILGKGSQGLPISMHDVLSSLPRDFVERYFFTPKHSLGITQLADIAEQFVHRGLGNLDDASVRENVKKLLMTPMGKKAIKSPLTRHIEGLPEFGGTLATHLDQTVDEFMRAFDDATPRLNEALTSNSAEALVKVGDQTRKLTDEAIQAFNEVVTNPKYSAGSIMEAALKTHESVSNLARQSDIPVSGEAVALAQQAVRAQVASTLPMPVLATAAKGADNFAKATNITDSVKVSEALSKSFDIEAQHLMDELEINTLDLGANAEFAQGVSIFRAFAPHLGNEMLRPILTARMSVTQSLAKQFTSQLRNINQKYTTDQLSQAFKLLQQGTDIDDPVVGELRIVMKELFNTEGGQYGLLSRNFANPHAVHEKFKKFGIGDNFRLDPNNMDESWRQWEIGDPLDFMSKFHAAVSSAVAEREIGAEIGRLFGRTTPGKDGKWVQIRDPKGVSKVGAIVRRDLFFPEEVARQMHMLDKTMQELAKPNSSNSFLNLLDSALHSYKAGVTIYRPGHHVRNMIGDMWLSTMDGVKPQAYKRATAVLATRSTQYKDFDALRSLRDAYNVEGGGPKTAMTLTFKGKPIALSPDQVYRLAFDNGVLPDYSVLEDVAFGATEQADKVANTLKRFSPARGKIHKVATAASEYRDHYVRIAHFIHALEDGGALKGATLEDALKNAAGTAGNRVRKWHPDGSDLSNVERNVMRRTVLFYSWVRKAIPLVVESAVTRPGRFMVYPKAMYAAAEANGIDLNGFGDPWPEDQLFPDYIRDSVQGPLMGEAGAYAGIKPGIPSMDVMDDFGVSPGHTLKTILGSVNPLMKVPFEAATDTNVRTGAPIQDTSDYIDQQIPLGSYIDKLAGGRSLSTGFTQETRVSPSNVNYEGNPNLPSKGITDLLNFLLGLGISDYSSPSSIKSAQFDQRDRLRNNQP